LTLRGQQALATDALTVEVINGPLTNCWKRACCGSTQSP